MNEETKISSEIINLVAKELLDLLGERPRSVIVKRFGLDGSAPMVLGKIGNLYNITRERVRQIEVDGFKRLQAAQKSENFLFIERVALEIIEQHGGFCEKKFLKEEIKPDITNEERSSLMLILNSSKELGFKKEKLNLGGFWYQKKFRLESDVIRAHNYLVSLVKSVKKPMLFEKIFSDLAGSQWGKFFSGEAGAARLSMILITSKAISQNILGEWGLSKWKMISQRGAREKAYLVLKKHQEPLHFKKITNLINEHWNEKAALPQTVHNELIKDKRFVLVGRGIYGLEDWGYPRGTVKEIIVSYLKEQGPVHKDSILDYVLSKKQVKKTTVVVTLADRNAFQKDNQGRFFVLE